MAVEAMVVTTRQVIKLRCFLMDYTGLIMQPTVSLDRTKRKMSFAIPVTAKAILEVTHPVRLEVEPATPLKMRTCLWL